MASLRRLFSTSLPRLVSDVPAAPTRVSSLELPPTIARLITKHLSRASSLEAPLSIPNPFVSHGRADGPSSSFQTMSISRRRQRQLLQRYPADALPPSPFLPKTGSPSVLVSDPVYGDVPVVWEGSTDTQRNKSLYGGRKIRFKGHKHERERSGKEKERADRMSGMEKRVSEWRKTKSETRASARPSLPF